MSDASPEMTRGEEQFSVAFLCLGLKGGMIQYSANLVNELATRVEVSAVAPTDSEAPELFDTDVDLHTFDVSAYDGPFSSVGEKFSTLRQIDRHLKRIDPTIIHDTSFAELPSVITCPIIRRRADKTVATLHDPISHSSNELRVLGRDLRVTLLRQCTKFHDAVIVHGERCKEQATRASYPIEKFEVLPHGLYTHFKTLDSVATDEQDGTFRLLFFGNMRPSKGFDRIPEIMDRVTESVPNVEAIVAGSGDVTWKTDERTIEQTLERLRNHDNVRLQEGYIPNDEVASLFRDADIVVLPYYDATSSGVAMTAYTFAVPMVATDTGDMGKMIAEDEAGLIAATESDDEIAEKIVMLLRDPRRREQYHKNVVAAQSKYSWDRIADQTLSLYHRL